MTARTQDEILARYRDAAGADFFGFRREVLLEGMTTDSILAVIPDADRSVVEKAVAERPANLRAHIAKSAEDYLTFAVGKVVDHRGISASRSVEKLTEYAWLLGRDDVVKAMGEADYAQYGAPQVRAFADGMGWPFLELVTNPADREALERMSLGRLCDDECMAGCGQ